MSLGVFLRVRANPHLGARFQHFESDWRPVEQIEQLEYRIEELREAIQRSRRLIMAGRACAVIGPALLGCFILGLLDFTPARMIVAIALAIGGVVLMGSSRSSTEQLELTLKRTEAERNAAIDALELVQLGDRAD
jgi:hypothetical protein